MPRYTYVLLFSFVVAVYGQLQPERESPTTRPAVSAKPAKIAKPKMKSDSEATPKTVGPKYLDAPFDIETANLGANFAGHSIDVVYEAVKGSPFLREKSEYETSSAFLERRSGFTDGVLLGTLKPTGLLAFLIEGWVIGPKFDYDADTQSLTVKLSGTRKEFLLDPDRPVLDSILVKRLTRQRDSYMGTNTFGATARVDRTFAEEFGVAFPRTNWLFGGRVQYFSTLSRSFSMEPERAKVIKPDLKLVLVSRLTEPWFRHGAHGHDPTVSSPYETIISDNYLQVSPLQLWVINSRTGEVIHKFSDPSSLTENTEDLTLNPNQLPLTVEVWAWSSAGAYRVRIDGHGEERGILGRARTFRAKQKVVLTLDFPDDLGAVHLNVNGKPYIPNWIKVSARSGSYESVYSATVTITMPAQ